MRRGGVLAVLASAQLLIALDHNIVYVALPEITAALGFEDGAEQWVVSAYALGFGGLLLAGGRIADAAGPERVFVAALGIHGVAALAGGAAGSGALLIAARAAQGVGSALLFPATLAILNTTFHGAERARALSLWGAAGASGGAFGSLLGGVLVGWLGWRSVLLCVVPVAAAAAAVALRALPTRAPPRRRRVAPGAERARRHVRRGARDPRARPGAQQRLAGGRDRGLRSRGRRVRGGVPDARAARARAAGSTRRRAVGRPRHDPGVRVHGVVRRPVLPADRPPAGDARAERDGRGSRVPAADGRDPRRHAGRRRAARSRRRAHHRARRRPARGRRPGRLRHRRRRRVERRARPRDGRRRPRTGDHVVGHLGARRRGSRDRPGRRQRRRRDLPAARRSGRAGALGDALAHDRVVPARRLRGAGGRRERRSHSRHEGRDGVL